ncbi:hypothetical protein ACT80S_18405 [Ramlibacter sp. MAHUQ-53]|uniref:hypothetical protein n=1 Tax=unclassified Ramlibacter TaxID=2617605 RepID=UPI003634244B
MSEKKLLLGPLSAGGQGAHFTPERVAFDIPQRITNSSSRAAYVPSAWPVRAGAEDHKKFKTRGIDA